MSYSSGDNFHLTSEQQHELETRAEQRRKHRGDLLACVEVRVFEHDEVPQVSFPEDATLRIENASEVEIADVVRRARESLTRWR